MRPLKRGANCPFCGRRNRDYAPAAHHLFPDSVLAKKFFPGRVRGQGDFGITYISVDLNLGKRVAVKEYFPTAFLHRESTISSSVLYYMESGRQIYEKGQRQFPSEAKTLAHLKKTRKLFTIICVNINDIFVDGLQKIYETPPGNP